MIPAPLRLRLSLATLATILRDMRRHGMEGSGAWRGVLRQVRRYADEMRRTVAGSKARAPS